MANARKRAGAVEEPSVGGDQGAINLDGERQERSVVEREEQFFAEAGSSFEQRRGRRSDGKRQSFNVGNGTAQARRVQVGL